MPDDVPPAAPRPQVTVVNQPDGLVGSMGLKGLLAALGNTTAMVVIAAVMIWVLETKFVQDRADRLDDRQTFRDSVKSLQDQADRHTGELRGSLEATAAAMRDMIAELRSARKYGAIPRDAQLPKAPPEN